MKNQLFSTFWYGNELPPLHWACLSSFIQHGHRLKVFSYLELELPDGVLFEDARQIIDEEELFEFEDSFSAFSNIFRYRLLLAEGCWWVDTDVYCLKEDIPDCRYAWAREDQDRINGALLRFPSEDPTLEAILSDALKIGKNISSWGELGPILLTKHLADKEFAGHFGSTEAFYPIHWLETHLFWMPDGYDQVLSRCKDAPFVHLWGESFKEFGIDILKPVPAGSFMSRIYEQSGQHWQLSHLDGVGQKETIASINAHLAKPWIRNHANRLLGYEVVTGIEQ